MLSEGLAVTEDEAYSILKRPSEDLESAYKVKDREIIAELFKAYEKELISLFNDTNDDLSIAQTIFVHTDSETEAFFTQRIQNSALALSASKKSIHLVNEKILDGIETSDSALAVCAFYYKESPQFKHSKNVL
jgi:hypothetical protein